MGDIDGRRARAHVPAQRGQRLDYLDSLRGLSALYVTGCHAYLMYAEDFLDADPDALSVTMLISTSWLAFGRVAVAIFIVLSGYCLMMPVVRSGTNAIPGGVGPFMRRRARRILPPYYAALVVTILLIALIPALDNADIGEWEKSFPALDLGSVLTHVLLIHNYFPDYQYSINHPMWSVATEWQIYFLFPLLVFAWKRFGIGRLISTAAAITAVLLGYLLIFWPDHNPWPPHFVVLFGMGMAGAAYNFRADPEQRAGIRWGRAAGWLFGVGCVSNVLFANSAQQRPDLLIGAATVCLMILCTEALREGRRPRVLRWLEWRPLVRSGDYSYSLYLMHAPLLALAYLLADHLELGTAAFQAFILVVGLPATIAASALFARCFERPFQRSGAKTEPVSASA